MLYPVLLYGMFRTFWQLVDFSQAQPVAGNESWRNAEEANAVAAHIVAGIGTLVAIVIALVIAGELRPEP